MICSAKDKGDYFSKSNRNPEWKVSRGKAHAPNSLESPLGKAEAGISKLVQKNAVKPAQVAELLQFQERILWTAGQSLSFTSGVGNCQRLIGISPQYGFQRSSELQ
jgi:hypothetical protein